METVTSPHGGDKKFSAVDAHLHRIRIYNSLAYKNKTATYSQPVTKYYPHEFNPPYIFELDKALFQFI